MALAIKSPTAKAGDIRDMGSIPGLERSPGGGHGSPLQYSCLENPMGRGALQATVHRVRKSWTQLRQLSMHTYMCACVCEYMCVYVYMYVYICIYECIHIYMYLYMCVCVSVCVCVCSNLALL